MSIKKKVVTKAQVKKRLSSKKNTVLIIRDAKGFEPDIDLAKKHGGVFSVINNDEVEDALMIDIIEKGLESGKASLERVKKVLKG